MANEIYILRIRSIVEYLNKLHGADGDVEVDFQLDEPDNIEIFKRT